MPHVLSAEHFALLLSDCLTRCAYETWLLQTQLLAYLRLRQPIRRRKLCII